MNVSPIKLTLSQSVFLRLFHGKWQITMEISNAHFLDIYYFTCIQVTALISLFFEK